MLAKAKADPDENLPPAFLTMLLLLFLISTDLEHQSGLNLCTTSTPIMGKLMWEDSRTWELASEQLFS